MAGGIAEQMADSPDGTPHVVFAHGWFQPGGVRGKEALLMVCATLPLIEARGCIGRNDA